MANYCARCGGTTGPLHPALLPGYLVHPGVCPTVNRYAEWIATGKELLNELYDVKALGVGKTNKAIRYIEDVVDSLEEHG